MYKTNIPESEWDELVEQLYSSITLGDDGVAIFVRWDVEDEFIKNFSVQFEKGVLHEQIVLAVRAIVDCSFEGLSDVT